MASPPPADDLEPLRQRAAELTARIEKLADLAAQIETPRPFAWGSCSAFLMRSRIRKILRTPAAVVALRAVAVWSSASAAEI